MNMLDDKCHMSNFDICRVWEYYKSKNKHYIKTYDMSVYQSIANKQNNKNTEAAKNATNKSTNNV